MAVSQYLRPESLLEAVRLRLTPDVVHNASSAVGESEASTRQALHSAVPSVLSGLTRMASTGDGATNIANIVREGGYEAAVNNPGALFSGGVTSSKMMDLGQQLTGRIFGSKTAGVSDAIARSSGVSGNSATKILSLVAPLTMGVLARQVASQGLNASGLASLLFEQREEIASASPANLSRVLDASAGPTPVPSRNYIADAERAVIPENRRGAMPTRAELRKPSSRWILWLLLAVAAILFLMLFRGRTAKRAADVISQQASNATGAVSNAAQQAVGALTSITLPGGLHLSVPQGSINYQLANYLSGSDPAPRTFLFDHMNFEQASTSLTPESVATVDNLASILKAYPNVSAQLAGYTDNTGDPQSNRALSQSRADAVKGILVNQGVSAKRIMTVGMGEDHPVASNDTEQGRASNRRLELTVTNK
jgi:OmpA-OmpF porin, OOP family